MTLATCFHNSMHTYNYFPKHEPRKGHVEQKNEDKTSYGMPIVPKLWASKLMRLVFSGQRNAAPPCRRVRSPSLETATIKEYKVGDGLSF